MTRARIAVALHYRLALDNQALSASLEREEAAREEDKEGHEAALRQVQQELGIASQRAARQEVELTGCKAQVRVPRLECKPVNYPVLLRRLYFHGIPRRGSFKRVAPQGREFQPQVKRAAVKPTRAASLHCR